MKILTWNHEHRHATLNVVAKTDGRYAWEVDMHDPHHEPMDCTHTSPVDFGSSVNAAVNGLRALDGLKYSESDR